MDICFCVGLMMNLYLSMAINKVEKEEKKTHVDWKLPYSLHRNSLNMRMNLLPRFFSLCSLTISGLRDQNLVMRSMRVRGIAIVARRRLEMARLATNMFRVVSNT